MSAEADFGWIVWPFGAGRKQIGLCFDGPDVDVVFEVSAERAAVLDAIFGKGAQIAALTAERDRLREERDAWEESALGRSVHVDVIADELRAALAERDRLRNELKVYEVEYAKVQAERDAALARCERMQTVVQAARAWRSTHVHTSPAEWDRAAWALIVAVDALDTGAAASGEGGT